MVSAVRLTIWCAPLALGEADDLALLEFAPPVGRAQAWAAREHDDELFCTEVNVVRVRGLARRDLPQARSEPLRTELQADPRTPHPEAGLIAQLVELRLVKIRPQLTSPSVKPTSLPADRAHARAPEQSRSAPAPASRARES